MVEDANKTRQVHLTFEVVDPACQDIAGNHHIRRQKKIAFSYSIQEALWRKLHNLKPYLAATKSINFGSEGQSCRSETKPTENQYACHDLSVWYKRQKSHLLNQNLEPSRRKKRIGTSSIILSILVNSLTFVCFFSWLSGLLLTAFSRGKQNLSPLRTNHRFC